MQGYTESEDYTKEMGSDTICLDNQNTVETLVRLSKK